jgi:starvation-inducible DNA-binding protein
MQVVLSAAALRQEMAMSQSDQPSFVYPTRIDIPLEIRVYLIMLLNQTLASTMDLRFQVKHAAWNVKGHAFVQLRSLFEAIACELDTYMDRLAARITVLGGVVQGTVHTAVTQLTLPEYPGDPVTGDAHVLTVTERVAHYAAAIRAALEQATNVEDGATTNIYIKISYGIETQLSLMETYLYQ